MDTVEKEVDNLWKITKEHMSKKDISDIVKAIDESEKIFLISLKLLMNQKRYF